MDEVKDIKNKCLKNTEQYLWKKTKNIQEVRNIFYYIKKLEYADKPDYAYIKQQLINIYENQVPPFNPNIYRANSPQSSMNSVQMN